jgi:type I restriction enzyme S subunit
MPTDLFAATPANACPAYANLRGAGDEHCRAGREHCEELWRDFEPLADPNFAVEFALHVQERWFEMYLTVALMRLGLDITCPKPGPDILLRLDGRRVWIEAVCATAGEAGRRDSVPQPRYTRIDEPAIVRDVPWDEMTLRVRSALAAKGARFQDYLRNGHLAPDDALVVAINVHSIPGAWVDMGDLMMRALYGRGDLVLTIDRDTGVVVGSRHQRLSSIPKKSTGAEVGIQPFIDGSIPHIAAVIGSRADACNRPIRLGDDLLLLPNLTARMPISAGSLQIGEEWVFVQDKDGWQGQLRSYVA